SPSSGHALTMLESTYNFQEIFQSGLLFDDIKKMIQLLYSPGFMRINIMALPGLMAIHEAQDLLKGLNQIHEVDGKIFCNNSYTEIEDINKIELPEFLTQKVNIEESLKEEFQKEIKGFIKHSLSNE